MIYVLVFKRKSIINVDKEIYFYPSQLNQLIVMSIFPSVRSFSCKTAKRGSFKISACLAQTPRYTSCRPCIIFTSSLPWNANEGK